jgi:predicted DNA-binding helix-hairpin-helix protein
MNVRSAPDAMDKLALLGDTNRFEPVGDRPDTEPDHFPGTPADMAGTLSGMMSCITHVSTPTGKKPVLKAMVTTACERGCHYCPFRAGRGHMPRVTFSPDELALAFDRLQRARLVDGIFLSSGIIKGGVTTQDKIIDTIEIIRRRYHYQGYIHLKIMPGAERDQILRAMQLADRVSINLEGPTAERLGALAPGKDFLGELLQRMHWAYDIRREAEADMPGAVRASIVTQFVVGAVGDTDLELLSLTGALHRQRGLGRAYFSAFNPVADTPFENLPATPPLREFRLYQASFLLRDYAWDVEDLPFEGPGNLRLDIDPKRAWAEAHLRHSPVEVMTATRQELMRVPGIGPRGAATIIRARHTGRITSLEHLRAVGIRNVEQAAPYILLDGHQPPRQLGLFS